MKPFSLVHALFAAAAAAGTTTAFAAPATIAHHLSVAPDASGNEGVGPQISFTTFNIRFYGSGSSLDGSGITQAQRDRRDANIRALLTANGWSDVIAFEEIVDLTAFQANVVGADYNCHGYRHSTSNHQHVTVCVRRGLTFEHAPDDDNYTLEDVAMRTLRPAVHGILKLADGTAFAHVVAVHLKAMPDMSARRLAQAALMRNYFDRRTNNLPLVVLGDFNTFEDDAERIGTALGLSLVDTPFEFTFYDLTYGGSKLDHVYTSNSLSVVGTPKLAGPCDQHPTDEQAIRAYNEDVSDHCPLTLTLQRAR